MITQVCGDEIDLSGRPTADSGPLEIEPEVFRTELVRAAHWVADYLQNLPSEPVIRPRDEAHRRWLALYPCGNGHPAFFGWLTTPPAPVGIITAIPADAQPSRFCTGAWRRRSPFGGPAR